MKMEYQKEFCFEGSDFDKSGNILPHRVLSIFQDVAGAHAQILKVGFEDLIKENLIWVVVRTKYEVVSSFAKEQKLIAKTWPLKSNGLVFRRDYLITDTIGNVLIKGTSDWMLVNTETRKLETSKSIYPESGEYSQELAITQKIKKLRDYKGQTNKSVAVAKESDIDANGHVNNTRYAKMVINQINCSLKIKEFQIDYHKEVLLGQRINLFIGAENNCAFAKGESDLGEKFFSCEIVFE